MSVSSHIPTAFITGGNSGIGLATAEAVVAQGGRVFITGRDPQSLKTAIDGLNRTTPNSAAGLVADVTNHAALDKAVAQAQQFLGNQVQLVFANAGIAELRSVEQADADHFDRLMDTNAKGAFFTVQRSLPLLGSGSAVVMNTSYFAAKGIANTAVLAASKAAVRAFVRVFAAEFAPRGIRVNAISPGAIATPIIGRLGLPPEVVQKIAEMLVSKVPLGRFGSAEEIAQAVLFLATNPYTTGVELSVDGGITQV
jgi:NAD(P)-dependent dehydrogenase (short-subunit alcohol dehydrogenase family)